MGDAAADGIGIILAKVVALLFSLLNGNVWYVIIRNKVIPDGKW